MGDEDQELNPAQNIENRVKKLALRYGQGNFSCLMWPCTMDLVEDRLHMTAKFFGDTPITIEEISDVLDKLPDFDKPFNMSEFEWQPVVFHTNNDGKVPVLEFTKVPDVVSAIHDALSTFRKDDYPNYRPHITVSREIWEQVADGELTPKDAGLSFLPLELSIGGLVKYKWGPDRGPVEEINGEDVSTINPTESLAQKTINALKNL